MGLSQIFSPIKLKALTLENRVIMGSMHIGLEAAPNGEQAFIQFYKERAGVDGPALMITGGISVSLEGEGGPHFLGFYREKDVELLQRLVSEVHQSGGKIAAQLFHAGRYAYPEITGVPSVAPSAIRSPIHRTEPKALNQEQMMNLLDSYHQAASIAKKIGFDAVEIMGSEGYLLNQFLSPVTNKREDEWGGSLENRAKFPLAVLDTVRQAVGNEYPIIFRLSGTDLIPNSTTEDETMQFAKWIDQHGADAINVGIGWHESQVPTISMMVPRAGFISVAEKIKSVTSIPIIGSNRINDPILAEEILEKKYCDIISMARPFLADPHLLRKARLGEYHYINTCIACNQACLDHAFEGKPVSCLVNPRTGREAEWTLTPAPIQRKIAIIGGGVAGMEAARAQAEKGHEVHLFEAGRELGGQLNYAKLVPGKEEFYETLRYYKYQLERLHVHIHLESSPTASSLIEERFEQVIIATGVKPRIPEIEGVHLPHVYNYIETLTGQANLGNSVAIIGAGGIGCDTAHFLLDQGVKQIYLLRRKGKMGEGLGKTTRWASVSYLLQRGVQFLTDLSYEKITTEGLHIKQHEGEEMISKTIQVDSVVIAAGQESQAWDYDLLIAQGIKVDVIGGARFPGELDAKRAIYEGAKLAYES